MSRQGVAIYLYIYMIMLTYSTSIVDPIYFIMHNPSAYLLENSGKAKVIGNVTLVALRG